MSITWSVLCIAGVSLESLRTLFWRYMGALKYGIFVLIDSQTISPSQACRNVPISGPKKSATFSPFHFHFHVPLTKYLIRRPTALLISAAPYNPKNQSLLFLEVLRRKSHLQTHHLLVRQIPLYLRRLQNLHLYRDLWVRLETTCCVILVGLLKFWKIRGSSRGNI